MLETIKTFAALSEEFVELWMKHHPVQATGAGIHDYDHALPNDSPDGFRDRATWLRDLEQRVVASVPWKELPPEHRVEFAMLRSRIASVRADLEEIRVHTRNPALYPATALTGIFQLLARPFAPLEERKESILARLIAVPDYLQAVRPNLQQVPDAFLGIASEINLSAPAFVEDVSRTLLRAFPAEAERIEHAAGLARRGFLKYQEFLDRDLDAKIGGTFAIGERWMNFKLEREHLLELDCARLEAFGREQMGLIQAQLEAEARRVDPQRTWRDLVAESKLKHPEPLRLREAYAAEVDRARRFVTEQHLVPLPPGEKLDVVDTPVFERTTTPYVAYLPPAPFDEDQTGHLFVTPIDTARRKDEQVQQLQAHCYAAMPLAALHETFPGHHVQLCHANRAGSRLRRLADSPVFCEGWALYCEDLMYEQGFFLDPLTRLLQLRDLLWRACRVVIDVRLQTGTMTFMQAVDMLVQEAMLERVNAVMEVKRYTMTPTHPMSYLVGKQEILGLRADAERRLGAAFNLHTFHAQLLAGGSIQPALAREEQRERLGAA